MAAPCAVTACAIASGSVFVTARIASMSSTSSRPISSSVLDMRSPPGRGAWVRVGWEGREEEVAGVGAHGGLVAQVDGRVGFAEEAENHPGHPLRGARGGGADHGGVGGREGDG